MGEIVRARIEPVYVKVPYPECEVPDCINPRKYDMLFVLLEQRHIDMFQVCERHKFLWNGRNFFPLNQCPPLEWVQHRVVQEYNRRVQRQQQQQQHVYYHRMTGTTTYLNFGGTQTGFYFRG